MNREDNLDFCIRYLMEQDKVEMKLPAAIGDKKRMLRALMNVWVPQPLSEEFLKAQDAELQMQLKEKGVVEAESRLWKGDITRLKVDAIVNVCWDAGILCTAVLTMPFTVRRDCSLGSNVQKL